MNLVPIILSLAAGIALYAGVIHRGSSGGSVRQRPGGWGNRPLPPLPNTAKPPTIKSAVVETQSLPQPLAQ